MQHAIRVWVVDYDDRPNFLLMWECPYSGKRKSKSSGIPRSAGRKGKVEAERLAGQLEAELRSGRYKPPSRVTWKEFRERYDVEVLPGLAVATQTKVDTVFNKLEELAPVTRLAQLTTERVSLFQTRLRDGGRSEATISGYLAHLKAALRWAKRVNLLNEAPLIVRPKRAKKAAAKGRDVTGEEFDRMLAGVKPVVDPDGTNPDRVRGWQHLLKGLWCSGLRLGEALNLTWDSLDHLRVDFSGKFPALIIPAELEKGHKDRVLPVTPDFAELLSEVPADRRTGFVFNPIDGPGNRAPLNICKRMVATFGEKAGVIVGKPSAKSGKAHKYASAHDLRRAFGTRWAKRLMPQQLKTLMRHECISTTLAFCVTRQADDIAEMLWQADDSGELLNKRLNTAPEAAS